MVLNLDLSSAEAQNSFIMDQQDRQISELRHQVAALSLERQRTLYQVQQLKHLQMESIHFCNAQYEQAQTYHTNFKTMED